MSLTLRKITNAGDAICDQEGNPLEGIDITFQLVDANGTPIDTWDATTGERIVTEISTATTDANGEFSIDLWPNDRGTDTTQYKCTPSLGGTLPFLFTLAEEDLSDIQWIDAWANGVPITPAEIFMINLHLADDSIHFEDTNESVPQIRTSSGWDTMPEYMMIAVSDEITALTTGTDKVSFRAPFAMTLTQIPRASLATASSSGNPAVDINVGGNSIFSTTLTIDATELTSKTAATAAVLSTTAIADDALITIDIDTAGTGAKGLKLTLYYVRA